MRRTARWGSRGLLLSGALVASSVLGAPIAVAEPEAEGDPQMPQFVERTVREDVVTSGVRAGDLDGDGRADLVSWGTGPSVAVRLTSADPGFATRTTVALGGTPSSVRLAHVDPGPTLDLVAVLGSLNGSTSTTGVVVRLGAGDGTFASTITSAVPTGSIPHGVAVGDLDGDGKADVAVGDETTVHVMAGDGAGHFAAPSTSVAAGGNVRDILIADATDDGTLDAVASISLPSTSTPPPGAVSVLAGDGSGGLAAATTRPTGSDPKSLAAGDVDGDGRTDLVSTRASSGGTVALLLGQPSAPPAAASFLDLGTSLESVALVDLNEDGDLDLVAAGGRTLAYRKGQGDGTFQVERRYVAGANARGLAIADLTGSSAPDVATTDAGASVSVFANAGDGNIEGTSVAPTGNVNVTMVVGDVNGDTRPDVIAPTSNGVLLSRNDTRGRLQPSSALTTALGTTPSGLALCHLDGDADLDLVASTTSGLAILLNGGDAAFPTVTKVGAANLSGVAATDLDGDGDCDVAATSSATDSILVFEGTGTGGVGTPVAYEGGTSPTKIAATDVDGDGDQDLVALDGATLRLLRNDATGAFPSAAALPLAAGATRLATADFDGDGRQDVAVSTGTDSTVRIQVLEGQAGGLGSAATVASATLTNFFYGLAAGDLNGDGHPDLILGAASFRLGDGDGTFTARELPSVGDRPDDVAALADADGNGTLDLFGTFHTSTIPWVTRTVTRPAAPAWAPYASWGAAVDRLYRDLLGRAPTTSERSAAIAALTAGTLTPGGLVGQLRTSTDHLGNVDPVARLYRAYFLRLPDPSGLRYWIGKRRQGGQTLIRISASFAGSREFQRAYGSLSNSAFVDLVYQNVLGRPGDAGGRSFWIAKLDRGTSRGQVMVNFSESNEYRTKQAANTDLAVLYLLLLGRTPTTGEATATAAQLTGGTTVAEIADALIERPEYAARL